MKLPSVSLHSYLRQRGESEGGSLRRQSETEGMRGMEPYTGVWTSVDSNLQHAQAEPVRSLHSLSPSARRQRLPDARIVQLQDFPAQVDAQRRHLKQQWVGRRTERTTVRRP